MSKLILKMSMSLDGYVARANGSIDWIFPSYTDDATDWTIATLKNTNAHLMGSTTYRDMAAHWPNDNTVFAEPMNTIPKIVFSKSMTESVWGETRFLAGDLSAEIAQLKNEIPNGYVVAHGGARFAQSLCQTGLIDEFRLLVHPVVLGDGAPIFLEPSDFQPIETIAFSGGTVAHVLRPTS